jgi:hypothetical protein
MNHLEFIQRYNQPLKTILLIGKRKIKEGDDQLILQMGKWLGQNLPLASFRSGNAAGADELFVQGLLTQNSLDLKIFTPYEGHKKIPSRSQYYQPLEHASIVEEPQIVRYSNSKKNGQLISAYLIGEKHKESIKGAYLVRDCWMVLGDRNHPRASIALVYDDLSNPNKGGTGFTLQVCGENNIPIIKQNTWVEWLSFSQQNEP